MGDIRCREGAELCCLRRVSAWRASRAREKETLSPRRGNGIQSESWDCNHLLRKKLPISPMSSSLLSAHTPAIFPAFFVLFPCLWGCRKAAAFLRLLFKDILKDAATAAPRARAATDSVSATESWLEPLSALTPGSLGSHASGHTQLGVSPIA